MTATPAANSMANPESLGNREGVRGYLPLVVILGWWIYCFAVYASGWPIDYERQNFWEVVPFFAACLVGAAGGYRLTSRVSVGVGGEIRSPSAGGRRSAAAFFGLACTLALAVPVARAYSGYGLADFSSALQNQGEAYAQTSSRISEGADARGGIVLAQVAVAPWTLLVVPYFAFMWFASRRYGRFLLLSLAVPILQSVLSGRDMQIGITILALFAAWLVAQRQTAKRVSPKVLTILVVVGVLFLCAVSARKMSRTPDAPICPVGALSCTFPDPHPSLLDTTLAYTASYSAQGFEGLGRAMRGTWEFGGGIGHSPALVRALEPVYDVSDSGAISSQLPSLGWSATGFWSTGFADYADDVPWALVPVLMALLAAFLGMSWRVALQTADPIAMTVFAYTWVSLFLMPQNLVLAISGPLYVGYLVLVAAFLLRVKRVKS